MIEFKNVSKHYKKGNTALTDINLQLESGEMAFLTGHSGAGKSTLLRLMAGLDSPSQGEIVINGISIHQLSKRKLFQLRTRIGIVTQSPQLLSDRTVFENIALPLIILSQSTQEIRQAVHAALEKVMLVSKENSYPNSLSKGEQQRVSIARAIVHQPIILIADEPTGNLDPMLASDIMRLFIEINESGVSTLIASHDLSLLARMPYRLFNLQRGRLT